MHKRPQGQHLNCSYKQGIPLVTTAPQDVRFGVLVGVAHKLCFSPHSPQLFGSWVISPCPFQMHFFFLLLTSLQGTKGVRKSGSHSANKAQCFCRMWNTVRQVKPCSSTACPWYQVRILPILKIYFPVSVSTTKHKSLRDPIFFRIPLFASSKHLRAVFISTALYCCANTIIFSLYKQREILIHPVCYYTCWAEGCSKSHDSPLSTVELQFLTLSLPMQAMVIFPNADWSIWTPVWKSMPLSSSHIYYVQTPGEGTAGQIPSYITSSQKLTWRH